MRGPEPVIKSSIFDGMVQFAANAGLPIDVYALMREVGLDDVLVRQPDAYVPLNPVSHLFERAAVLSGRPCFGLEYARHYPIGASGSLGFLMAHAPTMQDAIANLVHYIHAFTSPMHIEFKEAEGGVGFIEWVFPLEFTSAMPQYVSFALGAVIERLRQIAGPDWVPLQVELIHRELPCPEIYHAIFGPRVRFDAARNRMWLDPTTLARRHKSADERIYRTARIAGDTEVKIQESRATGGPGDIRGRLRNHLQSVLAVGPLELDEVADALQLEPRQLQYLLEQADTSFSEELSETRRMVAERLLTGTEQSMTEIASALGFSELSSFTRACRELWFGMSPSKFRARVKADGMPPAWPEKLASAGLEPGEKP
jgi:AraC-like DNA-binding protein